MKFQCDNFHGICDNWTDTWLIWNQIAQSRLDTLIIFTADWHQIFGYNICFKIFNWIVRFLLWAKPEEENCYLVFKVTITSIAIMPAPSSGPIFSLSIFLIVDHTMVAMHRWSLNSVGWLIAFMQCLKHHWLIWCNAWNIIVCLVRCLEHYIGLLLTYLQ